MSTRVPVRTHPPFPPAAALVRLAVRALPAGDLRQRYHRELVADLTHLDRPHQLGYATGVCSCVWALRRELTTEVVVRDTLVTPDGPARPLRCRLNLDHDWHVETTEDGARYRRCRRCGKDDDSDTENGLFVSLSRAISR